MDAQALESLRSLVATERVLTAAVVVDGEPVAALLPYAVASDGSALVVQVSGLARHAAGMRSGATIGVLVHAAATSDRDPTALPRLSMQAVVEEPERGSAAFVDAATRLVERFPIVATTLALGDFRVCLLKLGRGRYVEGFARAVNVGPDILRSPGADGQAG